MPPSAVRAARRRSSSGATLVEYAFVLSLLAIAIIPVLGMMEDTSRDEVANEFDCVSERPPPTTCQQRALAVTTTSASPTSTTSTPATTSSTSTSTTTVATTSTTATTAPSGSTSATWTFTYRGNYDGYEYVYAIFYVRDSSGNPVPGRSVDVSARVTSGDQVSSGRCTTGSGDQAGRCAGIYGIPSSAGDVYLVATAIGGSPALDAPPEASPVIPA